MKKVLFWFAAILLVMCAGCANTQTVTKVVLESEMPSAVHPDPTIVTRVEMQIFSGD